jgi:FlgN protein
MSRPLLELEAILQQLVVEHGRLLASVQKHEAAMKAFDLKSMDDAGQAQEASRLRIAMLEQRRGNAVLQLTKGMNLKGDVNLRSLARLFPARADALMKLRAELKQAVEQIQARTHVTGKLAAAVLGHLNVVVRLVAGVVEKAGLYTKNGVPRVSSRIGVMEAIG